MLECRSSCRPHVGPDDYQWRRADGDNEAGTTKSRRFSGLIGIDASISNAAIIGGSLGYVSNNTRDRQFGDNIKAHGYQLGAYAVFDPGAFYVKGVTTYSWFDGSGRRNIDFTGSAPAPALPVRPAAIGRQDVDVGLHGGARLPMGGNSVVTRTSTLIM